MAAIAHLPLRAALLRAGRPAVERLRKILGRERLFLPVFASIYALGIAAYVLVWLVDPFDLRPGGIALRLTDHPYVDKMTAKLVSVAARSGADLVVVGGSTEMGFTPKMLRDAFPESKQPVNLSFAAIRPAEYRLVLSTLETSTSLRRVILALDWPLAKTFAGQPPRKQMRYYQPFVWNDPVPDFDLDAVMISLRTLIGGGLDRTDLRKDVDRPDFDRRASPVTARKSALAQLSRAVEASRGWVTTGPKIDCTDLPALDDIVMPFVRRMAARGVSVDLLVPPYSLAFYSDWSFNFPDKNVFREKGDVWASSMALRRCTIEAAQGIPNVRLHLLDTDFTITANLAHYLDSVHLFDLDIHRYVLGRIARGDASLSPQQWPDYEARLKAAVDAFVPPKP
jgi:hypothetical protein